MTSSRMIVEKSGGETESWGWLSELIPGWETPRGKRRSHVTSLGGSVAVGGVLAHT